MSALTVEETVDAIELLRDSFVEVGEDTLVFEGSLDVAAAVRVVGAWIRTRHPSHPAWLVVASGGTITLSVPAASVPAWLDLLR